MNTSTAPRTDEAIGYDSSRRSTAILCSEPAHAAVTVG
jgi:hypothetical protein